MSETPRAVRFTFEFDGATFRQRDRREVEMTVLPSDPMEGYAGHAGFWYELQDASGRTLYRRIVHDPTLPYREVPAPDGTFTRVALHGATAALDVVVPDLHDGVDVVFFGTQHPAPVVIGSTADEAARPPTPRIGTEPAREIARFPVRGGS
jgi:hypothetical protein